MDDRLVRIGRLAAVAQGLEREGAYNGAKLARAALERELVRYAAAESPSGGAASAAALEQLVVDLGDHLPAGLGALLLGAAASVRDGRTIALADAPRARVCRACGEVLLGNDVPATCPTCEAPAIAYRELYPTWYLEPVTREDLLVALAAGPGHVQAAVAGHSDETLAAQPFPGEWSARQALQHLLFAEELFAQRVGRLLDEDDPNLAARAVWAETPASDEGSADTADPASVIAARIAALRAATLARLLALPVEAWSRPGTHPEWGRVTVLTQAGYFARHQASHMAQLVAAANGRLPGH